VNEDPWAEVSVVVRDVLHAQEIRCYTVWRHVAEWWVQCTRLVYPDTSRYTITINPTPCWAR